VKLRRLCKGIAGLTTAAVATFGGLVFWPEPSDVSQLTCPQRRGEPCRVVAGRVIYALSKDRRDARRPLHLVLASRSSGTAPGVSVVKIPPELRPRRVPGVGAWIAVAGLPHQGSNGEQSVTARRVAMAGAQ
jgi:hypothetical protein